MITEERLHRRGSARLRYQAHRAGRWQPTRPGPHCAHRRRPAERLHGSRSAGRDARRAGYRTERQPTSRGNTLKRSDVPALRTPRHHLTLLFAARNRNRLALDRPGGWGLATAPRVYRMRSRSLLGGRRRN